MSISRPMLLFVAGLTLVTLNDGVMSYLNHQGSEDKITQENILRHFSDQDIKTGAEYSRSGFAMKIAQAIVFFILLLVLVFSRLSGYLEKLAERISRDKFFLTYTVYLALFFTLFTIIMMPFSYYFGYLREHEFGFSNLTTSSWLFLQLKNYLLRIFLGAPLTATVFYIIKEFQKFWILIATSFYIMSQLVITLLLPYIFLPIYYDISELQDVELKAKAATLARKAGIKVESIHVVDASRYSKHTNAFFTGLGDEKKIYFYDTLLEKHTQPEVISILGHEMGHWHHDHTLKGMIFSLVFFIILCFAAKPIFGFFQKEPRFRLRHLYSPSSLPFIMLGMSIISDFTGPGNSYLSRYIERQADQYALMVTNDVKAFISAEVTMARHNKSRLDPHPYFVFTRYSHPPAIRRIMAAEKYRETEK